MSRTRKRFLVAGAALAGLLALVAVAGLLFVKKSRLERVASEALGMEVHLGERVDVDFFPSLHVKLEDVQIRNRGLDLLAMDRADLGIDLLPLFLLNVRLRSLALERYRISIGLDDDGRFNYEPQDKERVFPALDLVKLSLADGTLHYAGDRSGEGLELTDCHLQGEHVSHRGGKSSQLLGRLSATMKFACAELKQGDFVLSNLQGSLHGSDGVFEFEPITMLIFGGQGTGDVHLDRSGPVPQLQVHYSLLGCRIEELLKLASPEKVAHGPLDLTANLTMQGSTWDVLKQTMRGDVSLMGKDLTLDNRDLDKELSRYESSQGFNLVDVGGLFLAGPFGMAVTKGYGFASLFRGKGGSTPVPILVSRWEIERGVAHAKDVALATRENRLALRGGLDFVHEEFDDVTVAALDEKGCPKVRQRIRGPFSNPEMEKPNFLKSMAGPVIKLFKQIKKLFSHKECEVFYDGSVAQPKEPSKKH